MDELPVKLATVEFRFPNMHKLLKVHQTQQNMFAIMRACKLFSAMFRREYGASLTCSEPEYDEATREDVLRVTGPAAAMNKFAEMALPPAALQLPGGSS